MPSQVITKKVIDAAVSLLEVIPQLAKEYGYSKLGIPLEDGTPLPNTGTSPGEHSAPDTKLSDQSPPQPPKKTAEAKPPTEANRQGSSKNY